MSRKVSSFGLILLLLLTVPKSAQSCGFCNSDKEASVYRYESLQRSWQLQAHYLVALIDGTRSETQFAQAVALLKKIKGVVSGSVTASFPQKAVSFVSQGDQEKIRARLSAAFPGVQIRFIKDVPPGVQS
ncbi:MAG: hypothetical protein ACXWPM_05730 [Bdellovibrionota bacterium]